MSRRDMRSGATSPSSSPADSAVRRQPLMTYVSPEEVRNLHAVPDPLPAPEPDEPAAS